MCVYSMQGAIIEWYREDYCIRRKQRLVCLITTNTEVNQYMLVNLKLWNISEHTTHRYSNSKGSWSIYIHRNKSYTIDVYTHYYLMCMVSR